jgi:cysteine desulfurase
MTGTPRREIYADHAATTPAAADVIAAMQPFMGAAFGNASSVHRRGEAARDAIEEARARVGALIGASPEEIVFTATGSEANNLALKGVMGAATLAAPRLASGGRGAGVARRRIVISAIEHPSVLETAHALEDSGHEVTVVPVGPDGVLDPAQVALALGNDVALVSVMLVNNEIGTIQPVAEIARAAHDHGILVHCDAIQAVGKLPVDVASLGVDLLSLAGHKFHGPLGAAALFVRRRVRLAPQTHGGHQERSRRAGTENLPAIVGLGVAADRAARSLRARAPARIAALGDRLLEGLLARVPGATLNGDRERRVAGLVNVRFEGVDGEAVLHELDLAGITVSTGSACSAATPGPSHVLMAMGLRPEDAHASVRYSLGEGNDDNDVDRIITTTAAVVGRLRTLGGNVPHAAAERVAGAGA